jgi:hypothetical protein
MTLRPDGEVLQAYAADIDAFVTTIGQTMLPGPRGVLLGVGHVLGGGDSTLTRRARSDGAA